MTNSNVTQLPTGRDFDLPEGLDCVVEVRCLDNLGNVQDLTNATAIDWIMQPDVATATGVVTKTLGSGIVVLTPATEGVLQITIDAADSTGLPGTTFVNWYHRLKATIGGKTHMLAVGTVRIVAVA